MNPLSISVGAASFGIWIGETKRDYGGMADISAK